MQPFDAAIVNDERVMHGVTPIVQLDETQAAYRDVLVVTFSKKNNRVDLGGALPFRCAFFFVGVLV